MKGELIVALKIPFQNANNFCSYNKRIIDESMTTALFLLFFKYGYCFPRLRKSEKHSTSDLTAVDISFIKLLEMSLAYLLELIEGGSYPISSLAYRMTL